MRRHSILWNSDEQRITAVLENGDEIHISFADRLGVEGYMLNITTTRTAVILPSSGNAFVVTTPRAMEELETKIKLVVAERDCKKKGVPK